MPIAVSGVGVANGGQDQGKLGVKCRFPDPVPGRQGVSSLLDEVEGDLVVALGKFTVRRQDSPDRGVINLLPGSPRAISSTTLSRCHWSASLVISHS